MPRIKTNIVRKIMKSSTPGAPQRLLRTNYGNFNYLHRLRRDCTIAGAWKFYAIQGIPRTGRRDESRRGTQECARHNLPDDEIDEFVRDRDYLDDGFSGDQSLDFVVVLS